MSLLRCMAVLALFPVFSAAGWSAEGQAATTSTPMGLFQVSTLPALQEGCFEAVVTAGELRQRGNFGIGTTEGLDGEMIVSEGVVWLIRADGSVAQVPDAAGIPFGNIASGMTPSVSLRAKTNLRRRDGELTPFANLTELQKQLEAGLQNRNVPHLIVIEAEFAQMQTRSVPAQSKPYPRLAESVREQSVFRLERVKGVLVGFWFPEYFKGVNLPGFHLHFLSDDRKGGGHVLDCAGRAGRSSIYPQEDFAMQLPRTAEFARKDFTQNHTDELHKIEGK